MFEKKMKSLYDFPKIYDQVLCHDAETVAQEVESVIGLLRIHGMNRGSILELACGTCSHSIALATAGFEVAGLDLSRQMLDGARERASAAGVDIDLHQGNIIDFDLNQQYDCVILMSETFPLITGHTDIKSHFAAVRRHLRKGGIYVIDVDAHRHGVGTKYEVWGRKTHQIDGGTVEVWHESFPGDWVEGTSRMIMHCRIDLDGQTHETSDEWILRVDNPWNLRVLVESLPDWSLEGFFSWRDLSRDISEEKHYFMVVR